ncbi:hypothetical protein HN695_07040 [Candidatus Woesearchaeota archaeon]|jgi:hypothetical protein|nr:hypothetical protein [Candidatus Woesearchaeota archaeon]MBT5271884.1 hypothetical protein [Candidatus Woesearchaeota archaeon]MBT6041652.1 hypothetical protein [Candidatus Woesearchaeota archaeon]MBT6336172.1 hypothetical protein [Candidatus Woesearchaeota archaeon]MBT7928061.1 hypothetical protein [Candidatus Woesearchaeota archaeon]
MRKTKFKTLVQTILACVLLTMLMFVVSTTIFGEEIMYIEINEEDNLKTLKILDDSNLFYLFGEDEEIYIGELGEESSLEKKFIVEVTDQFKKTILKEEFSDTTIYIPYNKNIRHIKASTFGPQIQEKIIINKEFNFCNQNNICEPCFDKTWCEVMENFVSCPEDCNSGSNDNYCDLEQDSVCDPDCINTNENNVDKDCESCQISDYTLEGYENIEELQEETNKQEITQSKTCYYNNLNHHCMFEYNGVKCNKKQHCSNGEWITLEDNTACCLEGYCLDDEILAINTLEEENSYPAEKKIEPTINIEKYKDFGTEQKDYIGTIILFSIIILIIIITGTLLLFYEIKKSNGHQASPVKNKLRANELIRTINELHSKGMNYSKIKQHLIRRGYYEEEIDNYLNHHHSSNKNHN